MDTAHCEGPWLNTQYGMVMVEGQSPTIFHSAFPTVGNSEDHIL